MSTNNSLLPPEAVALVQHIELNKAGWWDKAVHRLVLAAVWISDEPPSADIIQATLKEIFRLSLNTPKLMSVLASLESRNMLLFLPGNTYRIPEEQRVVFEKEIAASEKVESEAKELFCKLVVEVGEGLEPENVWTTFEHEFLAPLIKQVGANAYRLVAGERMTVDKTLVDRFVKPFPSELHTKLRNLATSYIDPKMSAVRAYIGRMLHARFCVEASGLSEGVLAKLNASVGKPIRFQMFVDTNFLFSLLEIHENPSNAAAQDLRGLIVKLNGNPRIDLVITPNTVEEAKSSIKHTAGQLDRLPSSRNFTDAALQYGVSGMTERFLTERLRRKGKLTAKEWFAPYLTNFVPIARGKGVQLFNEKLDDYSTRQDVVDDILLVLEYQKRLPENKRKSYPKLTHDMVLWHFVNDMRPAYVESPTDANCWILTVDFRLIAFDEHKLKHSKSKVPLCIHPASLIQLLQFWVPRTKEFEEAMLGSLRLPFLFQELDTEGEQTSLKILNGIGRFEGSEELPRETITQVMLNEGLRSRLKADQNDEVEVALIRDALVEEMKLIAEAEAKKARNLQEEVLKRDSEIAAIAAQKHAAEQENALTRKQKEEAELAANQVLSSQGIELDAVKVRLLAMEEVELRRSEKDREDQSKRDGQKALYTYFGALAITLSISAISAWQAGWMFPWYSKILGSVPTRVLTAIFAFLFGHLILEILICRQRAIASLWPFRQVKRFNGVLWTVVLLGFFGGVGGNLYANWIQRNIDVEQSIRHAKELKATEPVAPEE